MSVLFLTVLGDYEHEKKVLVLTAMTVITLSTAHTLAAESVGDVNTDIQIGGKTSVVAECAQSAKKTDYFYKLNEKVYFAQNYDANSQCWAWIRFSHCKMDC
jgi:hypothetical protein